MSFGKIVGVGIVVAVGYVGYTMATESGRMREAFESKLPEFCETNYEAGEGSVAFEERPYRNGKVLVVRPGSGSNDNMGGAQPPILDPSFYKVSSTIRAATPAEVKTLIIALKGGDVRKYPLGKQLVMHVKTMGVCIRVFDLERKILVGEDFIPGDGDGSYAGPLARYIETMPVR